MITATRGDTFALTIAVKVAAGGAASDLTGWTVAAQLRKPSRTNDRGTLIDTLTVTIADPTTGVIVLSATAAQTAMWTVGAAEFDVQLTRTVDGYVWSSAVTAVVIRGDVTHV